MGMGVRDEKCGVDAKRGGRLRCRQGIGKRDVISAVRDGDGRVCVRQR